MLGLIDDDNEGVDDGMLLAVILGIVLEIREGTLLYVRLGTELSRTDGATDGTVLNLVLGITLGITVGDVDGAVQPGKKMKPSNLVSVKRVKTSSISATDGSSMI